MDPQLDYNLLFRWFVGLNMDDPWCRVVPTVFSMEPGPPLLVLGHVRRGIPLTQVLRDRFGEQELLVEEHFTVDGTLLGGVECRARRAFRGSFAPRAVPAAGGSSRTFTTSPLRLLTKRSVTNETHQSTT